MAKKEAATDEIRENILKIIEIDKPKTTDELVALIKQKYRLKSQEISKILIELESADKVHFIKKPSSIPPKLASFMFSTQAIWYWLVVSAVLVVAISSYTIPGSYYPIVYVRQSFGAIFILFLPGFTFTKAIYPNKVPIPTSSENLDGLERIVLSLGLSIALTAMVGLALNYTPWGIRLTPIVISMVGLTLVIATTAIMRDYLTKKQLGNSAKFTPRQ